MPVLCLHGWPGGASDYRLLTPLLADVADVVVPHLPGFGRSFAAEDADRPASDFDRDHMVAALIEVMEGLSLEPAVVVGYDVGVTIAVALARQAPERVRAVVTGNLLGPSAMVPAALDLRRRSEYWYQDFHQLELSSRLMDGNPAAVRTYLEHFWSHWGARPEALVHEQLVEDYSRTGAFTTSLNWYRSGTSTLYGALALAEGGPTPPPVEVPSSVLWGAKDPLFPAEFAPTARELLPNADVRVLDEVGHFTPIEAAAEMAAAIRSYLP
ncbi:alpha/beta hydrolase [Streptomyces sp. NBC_00631]|uniref:alpha/beta fold hydrolase n=1 Tax=Streptomyces sp. NBC_00631 TaxID=2975793 RepID=UPI0030DFF6F7